MRWRRPTPSRRRWRRCRNFFPANIKYDISYDITPVVVASIKKVLTTLAEAVVLVFLVMLLFLQNIRYTIIPTIVVPVALLGTCGILLLLGFSINVLTLFGMVLAIGILVDDAIVVVENVERIMSEEGLSPRDATRKAMRQITGAIIGITLVLMSVFVPMAFFPGSVGIIYRQFSASMIAAIGLSSLLALSLTPALCATILKPVAAGHHHSARGPFGWFNRRMEEAKGGYAAWVRWSILRCRSPDVDLRGRDARRRRFRVHQAARRTFCRSTIRASSRPTCSRRRRRRFRARSTWSSASRTI